MYAWCVSPEIMAWCGLLKTLLEVFQGGDHEEVEISFGNMHDNLEEEEMLEFVTRLWQNYVKSLNRVELELMTVENFHGSKN